MDVERFEDTFSEDDDAEFIELTSRPPQDTQFIDDHDDDITELDISKSKSSGHESGSDIKELDVVELNKKYLEAVGEIAVLRGKLQGISEIKDRQIRELTSHNNQTFRDNKHKLEELQRAVKRLEDEKKFYVAELKNPVNKKRKLQESSESQRPNHGLSHKTSDNEKEISKPEVQVVVKSIKQPDYKQLFLESFWNHCIPGSRTKTLEFLNRISLSFDYKYRDISIQKFEDSLGAKILAFVSQKSAFLRINELISETLLFLVDLIKTSMSNDVYLSTPFLLALMHNCMIFRTNSVNESSIYDVVDFLVILFTRINSSLNSNNSFVTFHSQNENPLLGTQAADNPQTLMIKKIDLIFLFDIIEASVKVASSFSNNEEIILKLWTNIIPVEMIRYCFTSSCPFNCIISMLECLISSVSDKFAVNLSDSRKYHYDTKFCDKELIKKVLSLLDYQHNNFKMKIFGLNRFIGDGTDIDALEQIVPENVEFYSNLNRSRKSLIYEAFPVLTRDSTSFEPDFANQKLIEDHKFLMKSQILQYIECIMSFEGPGSVSYCNSVETVESLVHEMGKQQDLLSRVPRSVFAPERIKIINGIVLILSSLLFEECDGINEEIEANGLISRISSGVKRQMIVILTRIAFSSTSSTESAIEILRDTRLKMRASDFLFNEHCETKARQLNSTRTTSGSKSNSLLVSVESGFTNDVEYGYNDDIIRISRDILEVCITPDEADNLFYAFVPED